MTSTILSKHNDGSSFMPISSLAGLVCCDRLTVTIIALDNRIHHVLFFLNYDEEKFCASPFNPCRDRSSIHVSPCQYLISVLTDIMTFYPLLDHSLDSLGRH
jgi:hypothetical protein